MHLRVVCGVAVLVATIVLTGGAERLHAAARDASSGPSAKATSADVEARIAEFWRRIDAMQPGDYVTAGTLGEWALNVIERDPSAAIRVDEFRAATAGMQGGLDTARASARLRVLGLITDASTGLPLADVCVKLWATSSSNPFVPPSGCYTWTDARGRYLIDLSGRAPAGEWWDMTFSKSGYVQRRAGLFPLGGPGSPLRPATPQEQSGVVEKSVALAKEPVRTVQVLESGFGYDGSTRTVTAVRLRNLNIVESAKVTLQVALYDASGSIIIASESWIGPVDPNQEIAFASVRTLNAPRVPSRMTVQVIADRWIASDPRPTVSASAGTYIGGTSSSSVTGTVATSHMANLDAQVTAIGYDAGGRIVGGGITYVTVPANGSAPVEVAYVGSTPTRTQLFAQINCRTSYSSWC